MNPTQPTLRTIRLRSLLVGTAIVAAVAASAQIAAPVTEAKGKAAAPVAPVEEKTLELSPFQVNASEDNGYQAFSTMSGTRLNTRLEDIAASISVVTKQQLDDTASLDINDVFRYELGTEGIYQWTSFTVDRGNVTDDVASNPNGATRMRGLTAANVALNGFSSSLPIDTYNVESIEISRGPNSTLFGLGATGGGVNINSARANPTREVSSFRSRVDSYDGHRASFDLNRVIVEDKLAIRVLGVYDERGFERKPSSDVTRRLNALVTIRPFAKTTFRASFESYRNFNNRPNSATPRDMYTDWVASGKPTWDPLTQTVHLANGTSIGPVASASEATLFPTALATTDTGFTGRPSWYIDNGRIELYTINRLPDTTANGTGPQNINGTGRLMQNTTFYTRYAAQYPLFTTPGITDQSLYDWTEVNILAPNFSAIKGEVAWAELEQNIFRTAHQSLDFQAAYLRERIKTNSREFLGRSDGGKLQIFIDINERLLDGTVNPYFLRPYVGGSEPAFRQSRNFTDNMRGTLSYQVDFTHHENWLRHLGRHVFTGYAEYRRIYGGSLGFKDTMSSTEAWMNPTAANFSRNGASFRAYPRYYLGDTTGQNVDYAPTPLAGAQGTHTLRYFNGTTGQWINESVDFDQYYYANRLNRRLLSTTGGAWQAFLLDGRVIPLAGIRRDYNRTRDGNSAIAPSAATNGYYDTSLMDQFGQFDWVQSRGQTTNYGVVVRPLRWLGLTYSQSDAFSPGSLAYNVYGDPLPDPRGKTKDYGFDFQFFPDASGRARLSIRAKQYETIDAGRGTSEINTIVQRAIRLDADGNTTGGDPDLEGFYIQELQKLHPTWTNLEAEVGAALLMSVDGAFIDSHRNKTHGDNSDAVSRGREVEITYNPTRDWTLKSTIRQSKAFNGIMSPALQEYVANRLPEWQAAKSPFDGSSYWNGTYRVGNLTPQSWYIANLLAPMKLAIATEGKIRSQYREWAASLVTNYKLRGLTDNQWLKNLDIGGAVRWEDKAIIGYRGAAPDADGVVRQLDANQPIYDKSRYYVDLSAGYNLRLYRDKVRCRLQLNVNNVFEDGRLQAVAVNPDGTPWAFRIIDPRQFILSASFDL
jgi:outer membrane receptor protein involved in Fe transport